jgi:aminopeptidase N
MLLLREGPAPLIRRQDYSEPTFWIRRADLSFDLDGAKTLVASKLAIERNPNAAPGPLVLHGEDITLLRVMADGQSVSFRHGDDGELIIDNPPPADAFTLELRNTCAPDKNKQLSGLYTSGSGLFTQCEA